MATEQTKEQKAAAVGHIPSGLFIVSVKNPDGSIDGYLASWVQQVSFSPLVVAMTIKPDRPGYQTIASGGVFSINIVGEHETQYMRHFWKGYTPGNSPFTDIPHSVTEFGGVAIKGAKSSLDLKFLSKTKPGDHEVLFAEVVASHVQEAEAKSKVHLRKSGLDY